MRAIAILLIVAYHAGLPGFSGGFIGVDIFFVISGFLITRNLLDESSTKNTIVLSRFWARRVRRLVPGLALMVVATLVASSLIVAPFDMLEISKEGASASLYISNIVFGFKAQNYFASNINKSPFLHTWSLGVEEQFYLVWPFVVYAALLVSRRRGILVRSLALPIFGIILTTSFAVNVVLTNSGSSWAFFSLPTRAWEFALGGLIAATAVRKAPSWWSLLLGIAGLAAIVYADLAFNDLTSYPGTNAVWPVAGAGLLILAGQMVDSVPPHCRDADARDTTDEVGRSSLIFMVSLALAPHHPRGAGNRERQRRSSNKRRSLLAGSGICRIQVGRESASVQSLTDSILT